MRPGLRGPALIAALALLWGSNFAWIKVALGAFTPTQLTFARMLLGALVLCAVLAITRNRLPRGWNTWAHLAIAALVANALPYLLFALGETRVDSSIAGVLNATTPLWTLALAAALYPTDTIHPTQVLGFTLGLIGCVLIFAPWQAHTTDPLGALYCLLAALSYAISYIYMAHYLTPKRLTLTTLSAAQLLAATAWTALPLIPHPGPTPTFQPAPWAALVTLSILGTGTAYVVNYTLIRTEGPTHASVVTYLVPLVSLAFGALALTEPLTPSLITGTAVVLSGVLLTRRVHTRNR